MGVVIHLRTVVEISYPVALALPLNRHDVEIIKRMAFLGYRLVDSGAGLGFRDMGFVSTNSAEHFHGEQTFWSHVELELATDLCEPELALKTRAESSV